MKKQQRQYLISGIILFLIINALTFPERGIVSLMILSVYFFVMGFVSVFRGNIPNYQKFLFLLLPLNLLLSIVFIIEYCYGDDTINLFGLIEYMPASIIGFSVGFYAASALKAKRYTQIVASCGIWIGILLLFSSFKNDYYYHVYQKEPSPIKEWIVSKNLNLLTLNGEKIGTKELENKVILLEFWDTYCGSCIEMMPDMEKISQRYKNNKNVLILSVNPGLRDSVEKIAKFKYIQKYKETINFVYDSNSLLSKSMSIYGVPDMYLINQKSEVVNRIWGINIGNTKFVKQIGYEIDKLLAENK